jgi:glycosyltransferase involved in cell wall biosynthesis
MYQSGHETHIVCGRDIDGALRDGVGPHQLHTVDIQRAIAPQKDAVCLFQLQRLLRTLRPDVLHAHGPKAGLLGMLSARSIGVTAPIYSIHGLRHETLHGARLQLVRNMEAMSCRLARRVLCVSQSVRRRALSDLGVSENKVQVLGNGSAAGVDALSHYEPSEQRAAGFALRKSLGMDGAEFVVGYVGRLARDKGLLDLAAAWPVIKAQRPGARLLLAGGPDATDPVALDALLAQRDVIALGHVQDPAPVYAALDVLVLPTYREGLPQVLLEAAAMQVPVVATRVTGCVDAVIDETTGLLVAARAPQQIAHAVIALLDDAARRAQMGAMARERVLREFGISPLCAATLHLYQELTQQPH